MKNEMATRWPLKLLEKYGVALAMEETVGKLLKARVRLMILRLGYQGWFAFGVYGRFYGIEKSVCSGLAG